MSMLCFLGSFLMIAVAYISSFNRSLIDYKHIFTLVCVQVLLMFLLLKTFFGQMLLDSLVYAADCISCAAHQGILFVFGALGVVREPWGFVFAFHVMPVIIFFSALISLLSYMGIIDALVYAFSYALRPVLRTSKSESAVVIAKSFLGPAEAQLLIRDYFVSMTQSELFVVMVSSLSMISASVFTLYSAMGIPAQHLIVANIMGIPGSLIFAKIIVPENNKVSSEDKPLELPTKNNASNSIEALIQGTYDGVQLVVAIASISISFLAIIALLNMLVGSVGAFFGVSGITFQAIVGYIFAPCGFLMGVSFPEALKISELIGIKIISNEMIAFSAVACKALTERGLILSTYALCGFGNIACVGIIVGSMATLIPKRKAEISSLAWYALLAATLSNLFSAYIVGIII